MPENGVYTFQTSSDDGSVLYIDNELVVTMTVHMLQFLLPDS